MPIEPRELKVGAIYRGGPANRLRVIDEFRIGPWGWRVVEYRDDDNKRRRCRDRTFAKWAQTLHSQP